MTEDFLARISRVMEKKVIEGYGITYRLKHYESDLLKELMSVLEGPKFQEALRSKFDIRLPTHMRAESKKIYAVMKYLHIQTHLGKR